MSPLPGVLTDSNHIRIKVKKNAQKIPKLCNFRYGRPKYWAVNYALGHFSALP